MACSRPLAPEAASGGAGASAWPGSAVGLGSGPLLLAGVSLTAAARLGDSVPRLDSPLPGNFSDFYSFLDEQHPSSAGRGECLTDRGSRDDLPSS